MRIDPSILDDASTDTCDIWTNTRTLGDTLLLRPPSASPKEPAITKNTGRVLHMAQKPTPKKTVAEDPRYTQALQSYESGLRAMQEHKFEKAKPHFQKVIAGPSKELADRATVHLNICNQHLERTAASQFKTAEEHFDYAVSLMNVGDYVAAREHLEKLLKQNPKSDYVTYGLAALDCLTGHV